MNRYARIQTDPEMGDRVAEVRTFDNIEGRFHPSLRWVEAPDGVAEGWLYGDGTFTEPEPQPKREPDTTPTAQDVLDAIRELADEGAEVERRIHERAAQKAQERAG